MQCPASLGAGAPSGRDALRGVPIFPARVERIEQAQPGSSDAADDPVPLHGCATRIGSRWGRGGAQPYRHRLCVSLLCTPKSGDGGVRVAKGGCTLDAKAQRVGPDGPWIDQRPASVWPGVCCRGGFGRGWESWGVGCLHDRVRSGDPADDAGPFHGGSCASAPMADRDPGIGALDPRLGGCPPHRPGIGSGHSLPESGRGDGVLLSLMGQGFRTASGRAVWLQDRPFWPAVTCRRALVGHRFG